MICSKCGMHVDDEFSFCGYCGSRFASDKVSRPHQKTRQRCNGEGSVYMLPNGKWRAAITLGWVDGKRRTKTRTFKRKSDAIRELQNMRREIYEPPQNKMTFKEAYNEMLRVREKNITYATYRNYEAAAAHFEELMDMPIRDVKLRHLQAKVDKISDRPHAQQTMRVVAHLTFDWAIMQDIVDRNYAEALILQPKGTKEREVFTKEEIRIIYDAIGEVPYAEYVFSLLYTGFRPNELFKLKISDYHADEHYFVGGSKTAAGKNRRVPVPEILVPIVEAKIAEAEKNGVEYLYPGPKGKKPMGVAYFSGKIFPRVMSAVNIESSLTPYCCRHTYATMLKDINAPLLDKSKLMGHTTYNMTAHYTHTDLESLSRITDQLTI